MLPVLQMGKVRHDPSSHLLNVPQSVSDSAEAEARGQLNLLGAGACGAGGRHHT